MFKMKGGILNRTYYHNIHELIHKIFSEHPLFQGAGIAGLFQDYKDISTIQKYFLNNIRVFFKTEIAQSN